MRKWILCLIAVLLTSIATSAQEAEDYLCRVALSAAVPVESSANWQSKHSL